MPLVDRSECQRRLGFVFPESLPQRGRLTGTLAASAVFTCVYVGAIDAERMVRPSMVLWMCDEAATRTTPAERLAWYAAARRGKRQLSALLGTWGIAHSPWYADNTREPLRDEIFRAWLNFGAILRDETVQTTSSQPQWSLAAGFAGLFEPGLQGESLLEAIDDWQDDHLGTVGRARAVVARQLASSDDGVSVMLPDGSTRALAPGGSSLLLKGVVEQLAPQLMRQPSVLFISESREHLHVVDSRLLDQLGLRPDTSRLLPDALLFDADDGVFWFVEVVFTDGAVDEARRTAFEEWAIGHGIPGDRCRYVSAFLGRTAAPFRRLVASVAWHTCVWFLDEPERLMTLGDAFSLRGRDSTPGARGTPPR